MAAEISKASNRLRIFSKPLAGHFLTLAVLPSPKQGRTDINQFLGPLLSGGRLIYRQSGEGNRMRVLAMASQKGGSGKTTCRHLAVQAQLAGAGPVCLIDIDPQGSLADWWNERQDDMPAFAQTTVARLASDLEVLRQQGFRLAVVDTPPAITMAIQSVIAVAELIVIPTRPSPHDLRAVGATVDLCDRAGKPLLFVVNALRPRPRSIMRGAVALSQHGTVAPSRFITAPTSRFDDRRPDGYGGRSQRSSAREVTELMWIISPTGSKRISAAQCLPRRPGARHVASSPVPSWLGRRVMGQ